MGGAASHTREDGTTLDRHLVHVIIYELYDNYWIHGTRPEDGPTIARLRRVNKEFKDLADRLMRSTAYMKARFQAWLQAHQEKGVALQ